MLKILVISFLLFGCFYANIGIRKTEERIYRKQYHDGYCLYMTQPTSSKTVWVRGDCDKYQVGDTLIREEDYYIEKID